MICLSLKRDENGYKSSCFIENIAFALEHQSFKLDNVRPHPCPLPQERVKQRPSSNDRISFQQSKMASIFSCQD